MADTIRPAGKTPAQISKLPKIEILELTPLENTGALRALFSVRVAGKITVNKMRLVQQNGQAAWCSGPQEVWTDATGKRRYTTLLEFLEREWRDALTEAVVEALRAHPDGIKSVAASGTPFGREVRRRAGLAGEDRAR